MISPPEPKILYNVDEIEDLKLWVPSVADYVGQMTQRFIFGTTSFDEWSTYVEACKAKGSEKIGELINTAWRRQNS